MKIAKVLDQFILSIYPERLGSNEVAELTLPTESFVNALYLHNYSVKALARQLQATTCDSAGGASG